MHYPDMRRGFNKVIGIENDSVPTGDSTLDNLAKIFEERVTEARDIVMAWG